jgi:hypothetical protein
MSTQNDTLSAETRAKMDEALQRVRRRLEADEKIIQILHAALTHIRMTGVHAFSCGGTGVSCSSPGCPIYIANKALGEVK